jgi:predicted double-glycine peptidase
MLRGMGFQQRDGACGPASLKIVLNFFRIKVTEKQLMKDCRHSNACGEEAEVLLEAAKKYKLKGFLIHNADIKDIRKYLKKKYLMIVDWFEEDDGHFSVVSHIDKENIYLQDPSLGHVRAMRLDIFKRVWFTFSGKYMKTNNDLKLRELLVLHK